MAILFISIGAVCASDVDNPSELETTDSDLISNSDRTLTDLNVDILNSPDEFNMTYDYKYNNESDNSFNFVSLNQNNYVINGNNRTIDADNHSPTAIFLIFGNNVTINNLTIKNAFKVSIISQSSVTLNNVKFINCGQLDDSNIMATSNLTLNNCCFDGIKGSAIMAYGTDSTSIIVKNTVFSNCQSVNKGFISSNDGNAYLENTIFENISSNYGAAIYFKGLELSVKNCQFNNLMSNITGGAIAIKGIAITDSTKGRYSKPTSVLIKNSTFNNVSTSKDGGAIFADIAGSFINDGNVVFGDLTIEDSNFINCSSQFGGAILQLNGNLSIINSNFTDNHASVSGGAIYTSFADIDIINSKFTNNSALKYGGAIYAEVTNSSITNSSFVSNSVEKIDLNSPNTIYAYDNSFYIKGSFFNNSKYSVSLIFTKDFAEENNIWNNDVFFSNVTENSFAYKDIGLQLILKNNSTDVSSLPSQFDLRDWGWVTPVKNQGAMSACWAFGSVAALESALLKATGIPFILSENNVKNSALAYSRYGTLIWYEEGNPTMPAGYALSWLGVLPIGEDVYDEVGKISDILDAENKIHVQDVLFIPIYRENGTCTNETNELIKQALINYGAVELWYAGDYIYYDPSTPTIYHDDVYEANHLVSIVGWDDDFSRDNFKVAPPGEGAWIIKNSWGTSWGEGGYAYISYYDTSLYAPTYDVLDYAVAYIIENTENYNYNYQTDFTGLSNFTKDYNYYSNEFTAVEDALVAGVGTYFNDTGVSYELNVYVNDKLMYTQTGVSEFAGFKTIKLNKYIPIKSKDRFKVVFKSNTVPYQANSRLSPRMGMSYVSADGKSWTDYATLNKTVCLKVYTLADDTKIINNKNIAVDYAGGSYFSVKVVTADGHAVGAGAVVYFTINGKTTTAFTDDGGISKVEITELPGVYVLTTNYNNHTYQNKVIVKSKSPDDKDSSDYKKSDDVKVDSGVASKPYNKAIMSSFQSKSREDTIIVAKNAVVSQKEFSKGYSYKVILKSKSGMLLANKRIIIIFNGMILIGFTDENGTVYFNLTGNMTGSFNITIIFEGDDYYNPIRENRTIRID